jgi:hypothetical protein
VRLVLAAAVTELLELQTASGRLLVLRCRVIPLLALSALQCNNFPHFNSFQSPAFSSQQSVSSSLDRAFPLTLAKPQLIPVP